MGFLPHKDGGCIVLTHQEHALTRTYKSRGKQTKRDDADKTFAEVLQLDINDLRDIAGDKYENSIQELIEFYEDNYPSLLQKGEVE